MTNKKLSVLSILFFVVSLGVGYFQPGVYSNSMLPPAIPTASLEPTIPPEPLTEECPLNGQLYGKTAKANWEKRRPMAVMIENSERSRPQSGISSAQVVYEGVSEGGVTRFMAIYYCDAPKLVGPVRSARMHFVNLLREWGNNPLYAHVGGANCVPETGSGCGNGAPADALGMIRKLGWQGYNDVDQFRFGLPEYRRDPDRLPGVEWEHTTYLSPSAMWKTMSTKSLKQPVPLTEVDEDGVRWDKGWTPWKFIDDADSSKRGTEKYITYDFYDSNADIYGVRWEYDVATNSYLRFHGAKKHIDLNTERQISAKNVIVIDAREISANDDYPGGHVVYRLTGTGDAYIFQNGKKIKATWSKETLDSKMEFTDENNKEISMVRGVTWLSLIPTGNLVYSGAAAPTKSEGSPVPTSKVVKKVVTE